MEIKAETIKSAICKKIAREYPEVTIYKNKVDQGFKKPSFFVSQIDIDSKKISRDKTKVNYMFNIRYHHDKPTRTMLDSIGFNLLDILENLDNITFSKKLRYEIVDDVLQFFASYEINMIRYKEPGTLINTLDIKGGLK